MKWRVSNWKAALFVSVLAWVVAPAWSEMYEWCDPTTGGLRSGDRPPSSGVQFWLDGNRPEPITRDGKQQPLCVPQATPEATPGATPASVLVCSPSPAVPQSQNPSPNTVPPADELELQKRNAAVIGNLVRQTPHYQDGSLVGSKEPEQSFNRGVLVLHRGSRDQPSDRSQDEEKPVHVQDYYRKDGTYVREHWRSSPSR